MENSERMINWYRTFTPDSEQRKIWYGAVAETYARVRPKYDREFLDRVVEVAEIPIEGNILEVGCGPGTATVSLAKLGFSVVGLEPIDRWRSLSCGESFDAVVAATSWHWVAPDTKHLKAASVLNKGGSLVLLWNTGMQPPIHIFEKLSEIFSEYMPTFAKYKDRETQLSEVRIFAEAAVTSLLFSQPIEEYQSIEVNYSIEDYLQLLTTYSPCIALSREQRHDLLGKLREILDQNCGEQIPLSYLSIFHIARKL